MLSPLTNLTLLTPPPALSTRCASAATRNARRTSRLARLRSCSRCARVGRRPVERVAKGFRRAEGVKWRQTSVRAPPHGPRGPTAGGKWRQTSTGHLHMAHPGLLGGMARPCAARSGWRPGRLDASCGASTPALARPQPDGPMLFPPRWTDACGGWRGQGDERARARGGRADQPALGRTHPEGTYRTVPYPTVPYSTLPYRSTLPYHSTLPHRTVLYPTLP